MEQKSKSRVQLSGLGDLDSISFKIKRIERRWNSIQLQVTGAEGAEGKDHLASLNSGEVKRILMGSLAGPESPKPWSHRIKLRAIGSPLLGVAVGV